jgi:glycosyltransferase involved in cell wall biosynthesis
MVERPLVSVLMTAYNRQKYIGDAIESVLASSYTDFELIIVDDGSADNTVAIAHAYKDKDSRVQVYVNEKNLGDYPNRNKAAGFAKGKYIKYLDADDLIYYYGLEVMVYSMEQFPQAGFGLASPVSDEKPFPIELSPRESYLEHFGKYSHFNRAPGSSIIKTEAFNRVGGFSGKRMIGDNEFWFKIARYCNMVKFPFDLYWNRIHHEQESKTGYAKKYPSLIKEVVNEALASPDSPLTPDDLVLVKNIIRKNEYKSLFFNSISKIKSSTTRK